MNPIIHSESSPQGVYSTSAFQPTNRSEAHLNISGGLFCFLTPSCREQRRLTIAPVGRTAHYGSHRAERKVTPLDATRGLPAPLGDDKSGMGRHGGSNGQSPNQCGPRRESMIGSGWSR